MILIYIVCADLDEARRISRHLLERRLAACTNIYPIESAYWWEGKIVEDREAVMIVKTVPDNFERVRDEVLQLHSYQTPAIFSIAVDKVEPRYLTWIHQSSNCQ